MKRAQESYPSFWSCRIGLQQDLLDNVNRPQELT